MKKEHQNPGLGRGLSALLQDEEIRRTQTRDQQETASLGRGLSVLLGISENEEKRNG